MFGGVRVIENINMVVPVRDHVYKNWMKGRCYHIRIAKKWKKRYGTKPDENVYMMNSNALQINIGYQPNGGQADLIVCHPEMTAKIRNLGV